MLQQKDYIVNTQEEYELIGSVKSLIHDIHESGKFFDLPLKTLELIRRFNNFHSEIFEYNMDSPSSFNQLVIISKALEAELTRKDLE